MKKLIIILPLFILFQACNQNTESTTSKEKINFTLNQNFGDYWYQGEAELTSYELTQVRYGQQRKGHAVLIYVTEDFSKSKQVKLDNPKAAGDDAEKVMKLNFTKKFKTGIYPYSIMTSVFSPVYPQYDLHARKITTSIQEWCGHVFTQLNNEDKYYNLLSRSYFESEGDIETELEKVWLEDELWTLIRLNPEKLPSGEIKILPSTQYIRLKHKEAIPYSASIDIINHNSLKILELNIPDLEKNLKIQFEANHPYKIQSWKETYPENGEMMTTEATLNERLMLDYWNKNSVNDSIYREKLGLE
ncbi:hypothetical protein QYS48_28745 [Marivirga arenosa]|uniref:Septum formation inhibitor Maf n=1 Tax=Marivirga arenosa TaxID=3059076 RepID=A0AA51N716_9BACT|nr:hypothetical protein [Marivirga sp. ABR2-2]WMN07437.1 hypothetical protein QYS48_28745 [Marivirga sp. ABR2-2]